MRLLVKKHKLILTLRCNGDCEKADFGHFTMVPLRRIHHDERRHFIASPDHMLSLQGTIGVQCAIGTGKATSVPLLVCSSVHKAQQRTTRKRERSAVLVEVFAGSCRNHRTSTGCHGPSPCNHARTAW